MTLEERIALISINYASDKKVERIKRGLRSKDE